jgi:hypothetical protein
MLIALGLYWYAAWDHAEHPVWRRRGTSQFHHSDSHVDPTEAVAHSDDSGGDDLGICIRVAAQLLLTTDHFAAEGPKLHQEVCQPEPKVFFEHSLSLRQFLRCLFYSERPFQRRLHVL